MRSREMLTLLFHAGQWDRQEPRGQLRAPACRRLTRKRFVFSFYFHRSDRDSPPITCFAPRCVAGWASWLAARPDGSLSGLASGFGRCGTMAQLYFEQEQNEHRRDGSVGWVGLDCRSSGYFCLRVFERPNSFVNE